MSENTSSMPDLTTKNITSENPFTKRSNDQAKQNTKFQDEKRPRGFSHQAELIRAAMPYANGANQQSMNVFLKVSELMHTMQNPEPELSTCSTEKSDEGFNMEGLLSSLKNVCYQREAEIINMLLNTFRARRFYQTYQTVAATMANEPSLSAASLGGNNGRNHSAHNNSRTNGGSNNMNAILNNPLMKDMLDSFMTPDQRNNFNTITSMINTMSTMNSMNNMNPTNNGMNNNGMNNNATNNNPNMNSSMNSGMNNSINNAMNIMNAMNNNTNASMNNSMNDSMNNAMNIMNAMSAMNSMNNSDNISTAPNMNTANNLNNDTSPYNNSNNNSNNNTNSNMNNNINSMGNTNPTNSSRSSIFPNNSRNNINRGGMNNRNSMNPPTMNHLHVMELMNTPEDQDYPNLDLSEDITPDLA